MEDSTRNVLIAGCLIIVALVLVLTSSIGFGYLILAAQDAPQTGDSATVPAPTGTAVPVATTTPNANPVNQFPGEVLTTDTAWAEDVYLTGDVTIAPNATLTISPGVTVFLAAHQDDQMAGYWEDKVELHVFGTLIAEGTAESPITFITDGDQAKAGDWGGINIRKNSTESILSYCTVRGAEHGIRFFMDREGEGEISGTVRDCMIAENTIGINLRSAPRYETNGGTVIVNPTIAHNTIQNNVEDGIFMLVTTGYGRAYNEAIIQDNLISNNGTGINILGNSWWMGHVYMQPRLDSNTIANNARFGIALRANGSSDGSGSDTNVTPLVNHNQLQNNAEANIHLMLDPQGGDGDQFLSPVIQCNEIVGPTQGIVLTVTEDGGQLQPAITYNRFTKFASVADGLVHNAGAREFEMSENVWDDADLDKLLDFCEDH